MKLVFFGTSEFAVPAIEAVHASEHELLAVITTPDRPSGRGRKLSASAAKQTALSLEIPVLQPEKLNADFVEELSTLQADLALVASYGKIIPESILDIPPKGMINIHPSLLPKYRGASPIQQPLLNGDTETGVTIIEVTPEMDAGAILLQEKYTITPVDTAGSLHDRLAVHGASMILQAIDGIINNTIQAHEQDHEAATFCGKISKQDGLIDWSLSNENLLRHVRAMTPWPGAFTFSNDSKRLRLERVALSDASGDPGTVLKADEKNGLVIACGEGALSVKTIAPAGKRVMDIADFLRGKALEPGTCLTDGSS